MSTEDIGKTVHTKLTVVRDILNSQYGGVGLLAALFWIIGKLSPTEYDQATHFVEHTVEQLNNPVGLFLCGFGLLVYINKAFFKKYLEKERLYSSALRDFEHIIGGFSTSCSNVQEQRRIDDIHFSERMATIDKNVTTLIASFKEHEKYAITVADRADRISSQLETDLVANLQKLIIRQEEIK